MQSLFADRRPKGDPQPGARHARRDGRSAAYATRLPRAADRPQCAGRRARAFNGALGHAPVFALKGRNSYPGVTNVRNVASPHWRRWLGVESRCVVSFTSFSENVALPDGSHQPTWLALGNDRPLAFFAGIWTRWTSVRKVKEGGTTNGIFAFLTREPNAVVKPIHPKAMPVILTAPDEIEQWLIAPAAERCKRPT